jgi:hypothetical protein
MVSSGLPAGPGQQGTGPVTARFSASLQRACRAAAAAAAAMLSPPVSGGT